MLLSNSRLRRGIGRALLYGAVILFVLWIIVPFWFTFVSSISTTKALSAQPWTPVPGDLTISSYKSVLLGETENVSGYGSSRAGARLVPALGRSFIVSLTLVLVNLLLGVLASYGLARFRFRGHKLAFRVIVLSRVVPAIAVVAPLFVVLRTLDLLNTVWALIITYNFFTLPLTILLLRNYFARLPTEVEEAAWVDGAGYLETLRRVALPLAVPAIAATGTLVFLEAWSEFFFALVFTNQLTVPPLLAGFQTLEQFSWPNLAAATVVALIPPLVIALLFQRFIVSALAEGAVK
jgi:ABC-type glycerol-3-phosphate transport system permease component